jgi:hypothetical protein
MIMPAIIGTIAQEGQAGGGGGGGATGVSIATTSSGNYDNAVIISLTPTGSSGEQGLASNDGSDFSGGSGVIDLTYGGDYNAQVLAGSGNITFFTKAFCRATAPAGGSIDTYTWDLDSQSNSISDGIGGTPIATQSFSGTPLNGSGEEGANDATGSTGVIEKVGLSHVSGGRGYQLLAVGDYIQWKCQCQVSAGGVDVDASEITIRIDVV